ALLTPEAGLGRRLGKGGGQSGNRKGNQVAAAEMHSFLPHEKAHHIDIVWCSRRWGWIRAISVCTRAAHFASLLVDGASLIHAYSGGAGGISAGHRAGARTPTGDPADWFHARSGP